MDVTELRCTSCLAPVDPSLGPVQRCAYCGTTLTIGGSPAASIDGKSAAFRSAPAHGSSRAGGAFLEEIGPNKIMVIKVVIDTLHFGLKASKDLVEGAPCVIGEDLDGAASEALREALRAAGARVR
jgi:ribosomal protein L7/L12